MCLCDVDDGRDALGGIALRPDGGAMAGRCSDNAGADWVDGADDVRADAVGGEQGSFESLISIVSPKFNYAMSPELVVTLISIVSPECLECLKVIYQRQAEV